MRTPPKNKPSQRPTRERRLTGEQLEDRLVFFGFTVHPAINATALNFLQPTVQANLKLATEFQDTVGQFSQTSHFDGSRFSGNATSIRGWYTQAVANLNPNSFNSSAAANSFGKVLHAIQDFYSHSNWVELQNAGRIAAGSLFDTTTGQFPAMTPYSTVGATNAVFVEGESETPLGPNSSVVRAPGTFVVTVNNGPNSFPGVITGSVNQYLYPDPDVSLFTYYTTLPLDNDLTPNSVAVSHGGLAGNSSLFGSINKDEPSTNASANALHLQARGLAERQTVVEFNRLVALVRAAYGEAGVTNMKQAWVQADYGDAPASYGTALVNNGPRHFLGGPKLGAAVDAEANGLPNASALGDDGNITDDEDGVIVPVLLPGQAAVFTITASAAGKLDAWVDLNRDGTFGPTDQIAASVNVVAGNNQIPLNVPATAVLGQSFARFRLSTAGGLSPLGAANDGEVEDHAVTISNGIVVPPPPPPPPVPVAGVSLVADVANPGQFILTINGTSAADNLQIYPIAGAVPTTRVFFRGVLQNFATSSFNSVAINTGDGNDYVWLAPNFAKPTTAILGNGIDTMFGSELGEEIRGGEGADYLYGQGGNDRIFGEGGNDFLYGGNGNNIVSGGLGNDFLFGGEGQDILVGGQGIDYLYGYGKDDLLIGNNWQNDNNTANQLAILALWTANSPFANRVASLGGLLNANTVTNDGAVDYFFGGLGQDWGIDFSNTDKFVDLLAGDRRN